MASQTEVRRRQLEVLKNRQDVIHAQTQTQITTHTERHTSMHTCIHSCQYVHVRMFVCVSVCARMHFSVVDVQVCVHK